MQLLFLERNLFGNRFCKVLFAVAFLMISLAHNVQMFDQNPVLFSQSHFVYLHTNCRLRRCLVAMETLKLVFDPY